MTKLKDKDTGSGTPGPKRRVMDLPNPLGILPMRNVVLFPGLIIPIGVGRAKSIRLLDAEGGEGKILGLVAQRDPANEDPGDGDMYRVGTAAKIVKMIRLERDNYNLIVQGLSRFVVRKFQKFEPYVKAEIDVVPADYQPNVETEALVLNLKNVARQVIELMPGIPSEAASMLENLNEPGQLADLMTANMDVAFSEKQDILETMDLNDRLRKVLALIDRQLEILKLSNKIHSQVKGEMTKTQREYYLRQQLKAIKEELGEADDASDDMEEIRQKIAEAEMSPEVEKVALKELKRLKGMHSASAEYTVTRTYLDWLMELPWARLTEDNLDIGNARDVLNADHYDLDKVKKRILEYLAVRKLKKDMKGPILCLVGPPGVGKTSLGKSIARALGRKFIRISLGGVRDEAEIRGHRRTYVGALPGRIIQGMKKAGSNNPVFMLDEVDKLGADFRGDPSAALLEVLDPEQNHSFSDHYLEVPFDLSRVLFIATANILDTVPPALRDRMEVIEIPGYTRVDKIAIARQFLIPKQLEEHGLEEAHLAILPDALNRIIDSYTREAGVRNLERQIAAVCRGVAVDVAEGKASGKRDIAEVDLQRFLGLEKFHPEMAERTAESGIATGLAWTPYGGDLIFVEATRMRGRGQLSLTGQLGDVMKESAHAALSFIRSKSAELGVPENFFERQDIHIHVPAGGIPKDGPSAGVTILAALTSVLTGIKIKAEVAMTGEITLRGAVLPVGGIKEKVLAAQRAGISTVILPLRNKNELDEVPEKAKEGLRFILVTRMDEVLEHALESLPSEAKRGGPPDPVMLHSPAGL